MLNESAPECRLSGIPCLCDRLSIAMCPQPRLARPSVQLGAASQKMSPAQVVKWECPSPPTEDAAMTSQNETACSEHDSVTLRSCQSAWETECLCLLPHGPSSLSKAQRQATLLYYSLEHWHGCVLELVACLTPGNCYRCHSPEEQGENDGTQLGRLYLV